MKTPTLFASWSPGELRVAAWDGALRDYAISRPGAADGVDDLHRGRIIARVPAMAGSFVALAGAEGFLPDSALPPDITASEGLMLGVRITRAAQGGKGPRLTARLEPAEQAQIGTGAPAFILPGPDALSRLARLYPTASVVIDDAAAAARFGKPARIVACAFDDAIDSAVAALSEPFADLPLGARMQITPTPALVAIDVDLGSASADNTRKAAAQRAGNLALLPALCQQIRLRNLSGAILVDLAGMPARKRASLAPDFVRALAADPLAPKFFGFTALGLAEILRPRVHPPLHELLAGPHAAGLAALRAVWRESIANPHSVPHLRAWPAIATALHEDAAALTDLAQRCGQRLIIHEDRLLPSPGWRLETPIRD